MIPPAEDLVSVVLPCHQAEEFLTEAMESLLAQTYPHLEILALNDGSTDGTGAILDGFAARDPRVRVLSNERNLGLVPTLNRGVGEARGTLIARMDADDVSLPGRIERQRAYLREHPRVGAVGSSAERVDGRGERRGRQPARVTSPAAAAFMASFATPVLHPTVMFRAGVLREHTYSEEAEAAHTEDYELFARLTRAGVAVANLPDVLLRYRVHDQSVSRRLEASQVENFVTCARRHLGEALGRSVPEGPHRVLVNRVRRSTTPGDLAEGLRLLESLEERFLSESEEARGEIVALAAQQRADILIQSFLKGSSALRRAALTLTARSLPRLLAPATLRYLAPKIVR